MFGRKWKQIGDVKDSFDLDSDTAPEKRNLLQKLRQIEAESLSLVVEEMRKGKEEGHMVTHDSDSTTKRMVGQFIGQVSEFLPICRLTITIRGSILVRTLPYLSPCCPSVERPGRTSQPS